MNLKLQYQANRTTYANYGELLFMYASFEDPENLGMFETAVCLITLDGSDSSTNWGIGSFYGNSSFKDGE